ncbi:SRPBCC family protein [Streptomyces sp. NPDC007205]|uniref:SRPBCC family protein n=1 Tax=Streptomyces sp. NPDC007205 TaxID=3154316 RepID=UPI0033C54B6A
MELHHEFTVPVPVDDAWRALLDIERVAPCLPGAVVEDYDGEKVTGSVKVRVGPVTVAYRGTAVFEEQDAVAHRMVLVASGRETRGQGTARAKVTGTLTEHDGATTVSVRTDLTVTGRPAQFGRGVLAEVGDRLVSQFATCLAGRLAERTPTPAAAEEEPQQWEESEPEPLDLLRTAGLPVAKRAAALTAAVAVLVWAAARLWRRRGHPTRRRCRQGPGARGCVEYTRH